MFNIKEELKKLPDKPGVYIMRDIDDKIIYVGKAISLKNRVRQYFQKSNKPARTQRMVSLINHFEYIVVDNEVEALVLECNLIKENKPKFNIMLKDDKTYPYIKVGIKEDFPNVYITRKIINDGAKYFGPYTDATAAKELVEFIKKNFKIRQCRNFKSGKRECLNFHIDRCIGPCKNNITKEEYRNIINQIIHLIEGKTGPVIKQIKEEIKIASENLDYEKAAILRDKVLGIEGLLDKQKVANIDQNDIDVIGISKDEKYVCIEIFFIRKSRMIGREHYFFEDLKDLDDKEMISSFIKQYYIDKTSLPNKLMIKISPDDVEVIEKWLTEKKQRKVEIKVPQKGEKLKLVEMAEKNAKITLENKMNVGVGVIDNPLLEELKQTLKLEETPNKIECFDISNISGTNIVGGNIVAINGEIKSGLSKRYKIKESFDQDDPKCMEEVITRRLKHSIVGVDVPDDQNKKDNSFGDLPDCIFVDGGKAQVGAAIRAINRYNLNIPVFGIVKNDKHKTDKLIDSKKQELEITDDIKRFVGMLQDKVHNFAIEYHKNLRNKEFKASKLDNIEGIGKSRKNALLKKFGSIEGIKKAKIDDLCKIRGITREMAKKLQKSL